MALAEEDFYEVLSDGLYSGATYEAAITDTERFIRILSHGLLASAPDPSGIGSQSGGLNNVGTSIRL